jgi:hypothetical protein
MEAGRQQDFINELQNQIGNSNIVPFISGSLWYEAIFPFEAGNNCTESGMRWMVSNFLASQWAQEIGYPLPDCFDMAKVWKLYIAGQGPVGNAKDDYIRFLKNFYLEACQCQGVDPVRIAMMRNQMDQADFSSLVYSLKASNHPLTYLKTLETLARLPFKYYFTTSYHNFLEDALRNNYRSPKTDIYCWNRFDIPNEQYLPDVHFIPEVQTPLVLHLFGHEAFPQTMVLSEDDYLRFFLSFTHPDDTNRERPLLHQNVKSVIATKPVLFMGFRLEDWDFKVLFHALNSGVGATPLDSRYFYNFIIHLDPQRQYARQDYDVEQARSYLEKYLTRSRFMVDWRETSEFLHDL